MIKPSTILVTRPASQAQALCDLIEADGSKAIHLPAIEILPLEKMTSLAAITDALERYDLAVFVSVNAVKYGLDYILQQGNWPAGVQLATVGPSSRAAVESQGLTVDLVPEHEYSSEGLLALAALQNMQGKQVVIFRGNGGRETLHDTLKARGAAVEYVEVYRRACPSVSDELLHLLKNNELDVITATSNETLQNLFYMAGPEGQPLLRKIPLVLAGNRQAELAARLGFMQGAVIAGHASDEAMVEGVKQLVSGENM